MKKRYGIAVVMAGAIFLASFVAPALVHATEFKTGDQVVTEKNAPQTDDTMIAAGQIEINSTVDGDLYIAGGDVVVSGDVLRDLIVMGGTVHIKGSVSDDVIIAGGTVTIDSKKIGDNLTFAGGTVRVSEGVSIGGDVSGTAGQFEFSGMTEKRLRVAGQQIDIRGAVVGNTELHGEVITLASDARLQGNLDYFSQKDAVIAQGALVHGVTTKHQDPAVRATSWSAKYGNMATVLWSLALTLSLLVTSIVIICVMPKKVSAVIQDARMHMWNSFAFGAGFLFLTPFILIAAAVTIIGLPLAAMGTLMYLTLLYLALALFGVFIGWKVLVMLLPSLKSQQGQDISRTHLVWAALLGAIVVFVLMLISCIPVVGWLVKVLVLWVGHVIVLGALVRFDWKMIRQ